jgi:hypothetical protein
MSYLKSCIVHTFRLSDVDDVELYAAEPIYNWQQTEAGKWVMQNAADIYWVKNADVTTYSYEFKIVAKLTEKNLTYFKLKFE